MCRVGLRAHCCHLLGQQAKMAVLVPWVLSSSGKSTNIHPELDRPNPVLCLLCNWYICTHCAFLHHRLRDDLKVKDKQNIDLDEELATLRGTLAAKDRALARYKAEAETSREKLTQTEGMFV